VNQVVIIDGSAFQYFDILGIFVYFALKFKFN